MSALCAACFWMPKSKTQSKTSSNLTGIVLDSSELVLSTLAQAAKLTPVPYLQDAAGLALNIVTIIQGVQSNKQAFKQLSNDACALVYIILCRDNKDNNNAFAGIATVTPAYLDQAKELADTLHEIYQYAKKQAARNKFIRVLQYKSDAGTVQAYRDRLKHSLDIFNIKSTLSIQDILAAMQRKLAHVADQTNELHQAEAQRQKMRLGDSQDEASDALGRELLQQAEGTQADSDHPQHSLQGNRGPEITTTPQPSTALHQQETPVSASHSPPQSLPNLPSSLPGLEFTLPGLHTTLPGPQPLPGLYSMPGREFNPLQYVHPSLHSSHSGVVSIGGDQKSYSNSVVNTNSGNTTTTITSNSNNDSSVKRYYGRAPRK